VNFSHLVIQGTNGGVSWIGLICSIAGGLVVGFSYYILVINTIDTAVLQLAAPQWPIIVVGAFGGLFGSLLDSILGATLQYSGKYISNFYIFFYQYLWKFLNGFKLASN